MIYKNYIKRKQRKDTKSNKIEAIYPSNKEKRRTDSLLKYTSSLQKNKQQKNLKVFYQTGNESY